MLLMAGIGIALSLARCIEFLRSAADAHYYNLPSDSGLTLSGMLVASVYGLSVTLLLCAVQSGDVWSSPGKVLALLFATMCIFNWGLEFVAAGIMHVRFRHEWTPEDAAELGYVFGIWYRDFAVRVGYVACLPVLLCVQYKARHHDWLWRLTWAAFFKFALLIIGYVFFGFVDMVPSVVANWYFEAAIGIPIFLMIAATTGSAWKARLDWWTTVTTSAIAGVWCLSVVIKLRT